MNYPGVSKLSDYLPFPIAPELNLCDSELFAGKDKEAVALLSKMLQWDPKKRITAKEALNDTYFVKGISIE